MSGEPAPQEQVEGRPWRGLSPQERRDARRRRLLDAALELFGTKGYAAVVAGLRAAIGYQTGDPRRARVLQLEVVGVSTWLEAHRHDVIAAFVRRTDDQYQLLVADGQVVDEPFEQVAIALVGALNELVIGWLLAEPRPPGESLLPVAEEIFVTVFEAREVARR